MSKSNLRIGRHLALFGLLGAGISGSVLLFGCGGGGGGSSSTGTTGGRPPFASPPTCSAVARPQSLLAASFPGATTPSIKVPTTSIELPGDIGRRVHTNHLISLKAVDPAAPAGGGLTPSQVTTAYGVPANAGVGAIAIVDAFNYPTSLSDFNSFSTTYGLPIESSTNATANNGVFQVVYATGTVPANDGGWSQEMAIDIEWAHAMAPQAKIYLVEAASTNFSDIATAVNVAKALPGVRQVSTSFGGSESGCSYVDYDSTFLQSGVTFFAAAGDSAAVRSFPALSTNVVSVGGTTLSIDVLGNWLGETVWSDTGCGPSAFEPRPVFQDKYYSKIGLYRGGCDIAAVGDPNTGVAVYDSFPYQGTKGWFIAGGTSVACPIIAGIVNGSAQVFGSSQAFNATLYSLAGSSSFHAITSGSAGPYKAGAPWCFPTGLGSPNGLGAAL